MKNSPNSPYWPTVHYQDRTLAKLISIGCVDLPTFVTPIPGRSPNFPWTLVKIPGHLKKFLSLATLPRVSQNRNNHTRNWHIDAKKHERPGIPWTLG